MNWLPAYYGQWPDRITNFLLRKEEKPVNIDFDVEPYIMEPNRPGYFKPAKANHPEYSDEDPFYDVEKPILSQFKMPDYSNVQIAMVS